MGGTAAWMEANRLLVTVLVFAVTLGLREFGIRYIRRSTDILSPEHRKRISTIHHASVVLLLLFALSLWLPQIQEFALSITAIAVALVIATKELLLCLLGSMLVRTAGAFSIGDWIRVQGAVRRGHRQEPAEHRDPGDRAAELHLHGPHGGVPEQPLPRLERRQPELPAPLPVPQLPDHDRAGRLPDRCRGEALRTHLRADRAVRRDRPALQRDAREAHRHRHTGLAAARRVLDQRAGQDRPPRSPCSARPTASTRSRRRWCASSSPGTARGGGARTPTGRPARPRCAASPDASAGIDGGGSAVD